MHYFISKLVSVILIVQVILVSGCSGFGPFQSILPEQTTTSTTENIQASGILPPALESDTELTDSIAGINLENPTQTELIFEPVPKPQNWVTHKISRGQSLLSILSSYGLPKSESDLLIKSREIAKSLRNIQPGRTLRILLSDNKELLELEYKRSTTDTIKISKTDTGFVSDLVSAEVTREQAFAYGAIKNSFFSDAKSAGLPDTLIMRLADIFAWDIDFALHIHPGDKFSVLFEELSINGKSIGPGDILAAEFINHGKVYRAVRFKDKNGHVNYYSPKGNGLRQAFLRTPVKFTRISSRFSLGRKHPVLNRIRAHKGVDYAAPRGTPVHATGSGKIVYRGRKGGYGKVVILKHGSSYSSLYAHLSNYRRGQRIGSKVRQGDIIGYVGSTGLATGPHLHYEFRVAGVHKNPLTVRLPKSNSIPQQEMPVFKNQTGPLLAELEKQTHILLASSSTSE
ncbi:MAG: peptidoglycan DD-metalloendopeptidase family protein [Gammaproteobacteria bacterium]|nr:peptidoglycan DD-metalloendopeptidase family protein [Gammaproteobacteria bacterium]